MPQKAPRKVLAYDLGGTKVAVGIVDSRGRILEEIRVPVVMKRGKRAVLDQIAGLGKQLLHRHPEVQKIGVASAGQVDTRRGILLDPTNYTDGKTTWGVVPLKKLLETRLGLPVRVENDAAAAILAEHWLGAARGCNNAMILTLGTGLGTGLILNGRLLRAGHGLHTEAGHMIIGADDRTALCGCGNYGCAEAYLSGKNFELRYHKLHGGKKRSAREIADLARGGNKKSLRFFEEYSHYLAIAIHNYVLEFAPEVFIFTGSFAGARDLFFKSTIKKLKILLARRRDGIDLLPRLAVSKLDNHASLLGGAFIALHGSSQKT